MSQKLLLSHEWVSGQKLCIHAVHVEGRGSSRLQGNREVVLRKETWWGGHCLLYRSVEQERAGVPLW